jgi:transcriptional regulator with XRE-family HTH domain
VTYIRWTYISHWLQPGWVSGLRAGFGRAVRAARLERGLSQEDLAAESGLDRTYISGLERGARNPALSTIERVSGALHVRVSVLIAQAESNG